MSSEPEPYELIFVNDDSRDSSVKTISSQGRAPKEEIYIVNMSRRFGVEECFMAGMNTAKGDAVILMYTDMQDPPETIHEMLAKWRQGADIVHTVRRKRIGEHPAKKIVVNWAYQWISSISDLKIPRNAGDFKLMSRRAVDYVRQFPEKEPYLRGLISWVGFKQDEVLYDLLPRQAGKSKVALFGKKAFQVLLSGLVSFSSFPVHFILFLSALGFSGTFGLLIYLLLGHHEQNPFGWISLFLLLLWATTMGAIGIIGIYVLKIFQNTTQRPPYIIKEVIRCNP